MKKVFKKILLFLLIFVVTLYFIGSCTERPGEYKPASENSSPAYTELTPEEYQRQMDELLKNPPVNQTAFKSPVLQAHAESFSDNLFDKLDKFTDSTTYYDIYNNIKGYLDYLRDPDDNYFYDHSNYPPTTDSSSSEEPVTSVTIPKQYDIYAKGRVNYKNNVYENIDVQLSFSDPTSSNASKKNGRVLFVRRSSAGYSTSFCFNVHVNRIGFSWSNSYGFFVEFLALKSGMTGFDMPGDESFFNSLKGLFFRSELTNSIVTANTSSSSIFAKSNLCNFGNGKPEYGSYGINTYTLCQVTSNDYSFITGLNSYQGSSYSKSVNHYYNNHAGDTVTTNNYNKYSDYGYTYNSVTNSLEFDPDVFANWFDADIVPKLKFTYDDIFSKFPDIGATFNDYTGELNNLIEIYNQSTETTSATGTYPVATGDINVNVSVDVTFPPEFYKTYPALTTEPAFVAENPDIDYALNSPLPVRALEVSGGFITLASEFIEKSGLMPVVLMSVALGFVIAFLA